MVVVLMSDMYHVQYIQGSQNKGHVISIFITLFLKTSLYSVVDQVLLQLKFWFYVWENCGKNLSVLILSLGFLNLMEV